MPTRTVHVLSCLAGTQPKSRHVPLTSGRVMQIGPSVTAPCCSPFLFPRLPWSNPGGKRCRPSGACRLGAAPPLPSPSVGIFTTRVVMYGLVRIRWTPLITHMQATRPSICLPPWRAQLMPGSVVRPSDALAAKSSTTCKGAKTRAWMRMRLRRGTCASQELRASMDGADHSLVWWMQQAYGNVKVHTSRHVFRIYPSIVGSLCCPSFSSNLLVPMRARYRWNPRPCFRQKDEPSSAQSDSPAVATPSCHDLCNLTTIHDCGKTETWCLC